MAPDNSSTKRTRAHQLMGKVRALGDSRYEPRERLVRHADGPRPGYVVAQQSLEYAISLLDTGYTCISSKSEDVARANAIIRRVLEFQVRDTNHARYGNFLWMSHWTEPQDPNAAAFVAPNLVFLYTQRKDLLENTTVIALKGSFQPLGEALLRHLVAYDYTNIKLLTTASQFLLAPLVSQLALEATARFHWKHFVGFTAQYGISEYNSPTYLPVAIEALETLWEHGPEDLKIQFERMLEYFYFELAARYHPATGYLAGAMSRAYPADYLTGSGLGALVAHLQWEEPEPEVTLNSARWLNLTYQPPQTLRQLALDKKLPLQIHATQWHHQTIHRTDYLAKNFTLGSQNGYFGNQEIPLLATMAGPGRRSIWLESSCPGMARLQSEQEASSVQGFYYFDLDEVRSTALLRRNSPQLSLELRFRLGHRTQVTEVLLEGRAWDQNSHPTFGPLALQITYGKTMLKLNIQATASAHPLVLQWQDQELVLCHLVHNSAADYVNQDRTEGFQFEMTLAPLEMCPGATPEPKTPQPCRASTVSRPLLHHSDLVTLRPNDLLHWLAGPPTASSPLPQFLLVADIS